MKKYLFFIFFLIFSVNFFAQDYTPMLELGKVWNMHHYNGDIPIEQENYDFDISLDYMETINSIEYFHATNGDFFREDLVNKKIYRLRNDVEELILDFDLEIGDAITSPLLAIDNTFVNEISIIGTDTFHNIANLKYYQIDCGEKIIEGIGFANVGLFGYSTFCSTLTFSEGDYLINMSTLSINDYFAKNNIKLLYNPQEKKLKLNNNSELVNINIYSTLGKKVISAHTNEFVDVSYIKSGIYFYSLSNGNSVKKGKILIF